MKMCNGPCAQSKPLSDFPTLKVGRVLRHRSMCRICHNEDRVMRDKAKPVNADGRQVRYRAKMSAARAKGENLTRWILADSRGSDQKYDRKNDLTWEFVERMIGFACAYCGETNLRMTLDRINNSIGHIQSNVVPACIRCNYIRRDMPYAAWFFLLPALREARINGLFGEWVPSTHRSRR